MKVSELLDAEWLKITDLENAFSVYTDDRGRYVYNLNESVYISVPDDQLSEFTCDCTMHWPLISYKIYGTTRLAWLLMKLNNVSPDEVFDAKKPADVVKYLDVDYVQTIVKNVNGYEDY